MKTITLHVSEETYRAFQDFAAKSNQSAAELIREAMDSITRLTSVAMGASSMIRAPTRGESSRHFRQTTTC
jgi:predicted transcriptional regulator